VLTDWCGIIVVGDCCWKINK